MIGIINYGSGNIFAIATVHKRINVEYKIVESIADFIGCDKLILPGVGAFDETMQLIKKKNLFDSINEMVLIKKVPIIGFCVGMQIMGNSSEEGSESGFGWIEGKIKKLDASLLTHKPHLPHLGWNTIEPVTSSPLLDNIDHKMGFYFLHNYYFDVAEQSNVIAKVNYGLNFPCIINNKNIFGVQFHPEKSHGNGIELFRNFANL